MDPLDTFRADMALALSPIHGIANQYRQRAEQEREDRITKEERAFKREMLDAELSGRKALVDAEIQGRKDVAGLEHNFREGEAKKLRDHEITMFDKESERRKTEREIRLEDEAKKRKADLINANRMKDDADLKEMGKKVGLNPVYFVKEDGDFDREAYADALGTEQIRKVKYLEESKGRKLTELMASDSGQRDTGISPKIAQLRRQVVQQIAGKEEVFNILSDKLGDKKAYELIDKLSKPLNEGGITLKTVQGMIIGKRGWLGQGDKYQKAARLDQMVSEEMSALAPSVLDAESKKLLQEDLQRKQVLMKEILQYDNEVAEIRQAMSAAHAEILAHGERTMSDQPNDYQAMVAAINAENKMVANDPDDQTDPEDPGEMKKIPSDLKAIPTAPVPAPDEDAVMNADLGSSIEKGKQAISEEKAARSLWIDRHERIQAHVRRREILTEMQKLINKLENPKTQEAVSGRSVGPGAAPAIEYRDRELTQEEKNVILSDLHQLRKELKKLRDQAGPATNE